MNKLYPIHLQLLGKKVVIVGGGQVAERKLIALLETGAYISIISLTITDNIKKIIKTNNNILWKQKEFTKDDINEAHIIIAATNKDDVNEKIKNSLNEYQLINLASNSDESSFHTPAVIRKGKLTISVSTSGASPKLTKQICKQIDSLYDKNYEEYIDFLYESRKWILENAFDPKLKQLLLSEIVSDEFLNDKNRFERFQNLITKYTKNK